MESEKIEEEEEEKKRGRDLHCTSFGSSARRQRVIGREREKEKEEEKNRFNFTVCTNFGLHQFTLTKKKGVKLWGRGQVHKNQTACHTSIRAKKKKYRDKTLEEEVKFSFS